MNAQSEFTPNDWDFYATCYDTLLQLKPYRELIDQVATEIDTRPSDKLLDLACGTGSLLATLANRLQLSELSGIDFSPSMLQQAKLKVRPGRVEFRQGDVNNILPWQNDHFDKVVCVNALYTFNSPESSLREVYRILKPGGDIILVTPKQEFENGLVLKAHAGSDKPDSYWSNSHASAEREECLIRSAIKDESVVKQMIYVAEHNRKIARTITFHFFTSQALEKLFTECNFSILKMVPVYADQCILVRARKKP